MQLDSILNTSELSEDAINNVYPKVWAKDFIAHHGIKGQKWGIRRFQNSDGSLTDAGRKRYSGSKGKEKLRKDFKDDPAGEGKVLKQIASDKKNKAVSALTDSLKNKGTDLYADSQYLKEKGYVKNDRQAAEYLIKAAQKCNENYDDDVSIFQSLGRELDLYQKGYIDKKTFDALYDARAAEDVMEFERNSYDWHGEGSKGAVNANNYKSNLNNRLSYYFGDNPTNPEYNPNKPVSVSNEDYDDLTYFREINHSIQNEAKDFIAHHGIKGQKWGLRRYQNSDGSLTPEGRTHYGVGSSLKKAGSAIGKAAGKTVRKALRRQTDEELEAEYQKAQKRNERRAKQKYIDESKGKRKPLHKMNNDELDEYIDRLTKERNVKRMEKELKEMNRGPAKKMISSLADNAVAGIGEGLKRGVSSKIETSMRKNEERKQSLKDKAFEDKHKSASERASERLQKQKNDSQNKLDVVRNETERKALLGNETYSKRLEDVAAAKKGNKSSNDYGGKDALAKLEAAEYKMAYQALFSDDAKKRYKNYREATGRGSGKGKKGNN